MSNTGEDGLSPAEGTDSDETVLVEEEAKEVEEETAYADEMKQIASDVSSKVTAMDVATVNAGSVDDATTTPIVNTSEVVSDPSNPDQRLSDMEKQLGAILDKVSKSSDADKKGVVSRYLGIGFTVITVGAAGVFLLEYFMRKANKQPTDDLPPPSPDVEAQIESLYNQWQATPDSSFWQSLAAYVLKNPTSLTAADQIVFMNYTIKLSPLASPFFWDTYGDKATEAQKLVDVYNGQAAVASSLASANGASTATALANMYTFAATHSYQGSPIPRSVEADLLRLALAWIFQLPTTESGGGTT